MVSRDAQRLGMEFVVPYSKVILEKKRLIRAKKIQTYHVLAQ